jgi:hypothetical protein
MSWEEREAEQEFRRLALLERFKYDSYEEFVAGARFIENLARWLQQFASADRETAYSFVKLRLLFITNAEIERLVDAFFPTVVYYDILDVVANALGTRRFEALRSNKGQRLFQLEVRKSLFVGASDGAKTDVLRRFNVGRLVNDQVVLTPDIGDTRWDEALSDLRKAVGDNTAAFTRIYLIDDFTASGTTFCEKRDGLWKGKLPRFFDSFDKAAQRGAIVEDAPILVHHYLGTMQADKALKEALKKARDEGGNNGWFKGNVRLKFGRILDSDIPLKSPADAPFMELCMKYYDKSIEKPEHGQIDLQLGYKNARLPLVLQHNTPNNTVPLVWKESDGKEGHPMRSLFRRRERH